MKAITRETIIDRRAPAFRWSAVFAGTIVGAVVWLVLETFGTGIMLDSVGSDRTMHLGSGSALWAVLAPFLAMLAGGAIAGRFAGTYDRRTGAAHGLVTWALANAIGFLIVTWIVTTVAAGAGITMVNNDPNAAPNAAALAAGRALMCGGVSLVVSLVGAVIGGAFGVRRDHGDLPRTTVPVPVPVPVTVAVVHPPVVVPPPPVQPIE